MEYNIMEMAELARQSSIKHRKAMPYLYPSYLKMMNAKDKLEAAKREYEAAKRQWQAELR